MNATMSILEHNIGLTFSSVECIQIDLNRSPVRHVIPTWPFEKDTALLDSEHCSLNVFHWVGNFILFHACKMMGFLYLIIRNILWKPSWSVSLLQLSLLLSSLIKRACSKESLNSGKLILLILHRKRTGNTLCCRSRYSFVQHKKKLGWPFY